MIIKSKNVFTGLKDTTEPLAILVKGKTIERILPYDYDHLADYQEISNERVIDYEEKLIMPSFVDAHTHVISGAIDGSKYVCNTLGECKSQSQCVEMIRAFAMSHPELTRIRGTGWFVGAWNDAPLPDRRSLDEVFPDKPVYLRCADGHSIWLNSKAIEESGYQRDFEVENGVVCRFSDGSLSGLFIEPAALEPAMKQYLNFSDEELKSIHEEFQNDLASLGISAVSEMFADDYTNETRKNLSFYQELEKENKLYSNIFMYTKLFGYTDFQPFFQLKKDMDTRHLKIAGVKGFLDGVTETYTGLLLEPYTDKPETCGDHLPLWPKEKMQEEIIAANKAGIQVRLHCIADGSVRMALDLYEKSIKENGVQNLGNTIEHIENIHPSDIPRFKKLGVIPSMQPYHVTLSNNGKILRLGKERCKYEFPIRTMYESCGRVGIGTDYPVVTINPFTTIYAALTRCDSNGMEICQNADAQKLELPVILRSYTQTGAQIYHIEEKVGTLEKGKMANIIVLDQNLFTIPVKEIEHTKVQVNYFEGREVYHG